MSEILEKLNERQKEAVLYNQGPLAIIAGAGSGKTRTLSHKIAYLIKEKGLKPYRILAVTFTNKAAKELKERVSNIVGPQGQDVKVFTYHSFCAWVLRQEIDNVEKYKQFKIIDTGDQLVILNRIYKEIELAKSTLRPKDALHKISKFKSSLLDPKEAEDSSSTDEDKLIAKIYEKYQKATVEAGYFDFDDLLVQTRQLFMNNKEVAQKWTNKFDYVMVDEFQDTSIIQGDIVDSIVGHGNFAVVGDPDQTIYSWRMADYKLITNFKDRYQDGHVVLLEENYRSTPQILNAANKLISNNKNRYDKNLYTSKNDGAEIVFKVSMSEDAEARWVAEEINKLKREKVQLRDIAILYRNNYLTRSLETIFLSEGINFGIYGGTRFYERQEIKEVISFMNVIDNGDEVSFRRVVNVPARKIGPKSQDSIINFAEQKGLPTYEAIIKHFAELELPKSSKLALRDFVQAVRGYGAAIKSNQYKISEVIEKFLITIDYYSVWKGEENQGRLEAIEELFKSIDKWQLDHPDLTMSDYLEEISLLLEKEEGVKNKDFVSMMTVHSSKGLEFDNVFIFEFTEGTFPSTRSIDEYEDETGIEEERRLAYVATTRARKKLYISTSKGFARNGDRAPKNPSRFVKEMGIIDDSARTYKHSIVSEVNSTNILEGDTVIHEKFGRGVVVAVGGNIATIKFVDHGEKQLLKRHKSIVKVEG